MVSDHRSSSAFDYADLAVVDIDYGLTIEEFKQHRSVLACWGYTTASHGVEGDATESSSDCPTESRTPTSSRVSCHY